MTHSNDSLDMSGASLVNALPTPPPSHDDEPPPTPAPQDVYYAYETRLSQSSYRTDTSASSVLEQRRRKRQQEEEQARAERAPSRRQLLWGHIKSLSLAVIRFVLKNNNWALTINLLHHLWRARTLFIQPYKRTLRAVAKGEPQRWAKYAWRDAVRLMGAMHLFFAMLTGFALKRHRVSTDRSALLLLALASIGQSTSRASAYWRSGATYTLRALRDAGLLDAIVFFVTSIAFSKTARRTGRLL
ncbi:hypothetical protein BCR43DRAFT_484715 [Syncephalastrum racemosum]|uniref:Uncharacterized protein n=1 Tax=Syncephalastrum racemosum TaxID=13706 RepID=A0A1X2HLA9_SYNRA|nr:hypothetical protein BCR43DRAFT_484715 [Syncephalastrum racemosum]